MPAKRNKKDKINLLPQEEFAASTVGRILAWLLSSFRTIVIVSEMIVMGAFLSRFWLDARNADLTDSIKQRQAIVTSYETFEKNFRAAQKSLTIFTSLTNSQADFLSVINKTSSFLPGNVKVLSYTLTADLLEIRGSSLAEEDIAVFVGNMKTSNFYNDIQLSTLGLDDKTSSITFTVKATLKPVAKGGKNG